MNAADRSGGELLILGDSLAFHGPHGPHPANEPRLWPNVAAAQLGGTAHLVAGLGWTARDAWWALTGDPRVWAALPAVRAVVLGVGSMDTLPSPLPTALREGIRYLRPDVLRRRVRSGYRRLQPTLSRLMGGRPVALPPRLTVRYLDECRRAIRALRPELPIIAMVPSVHRADSYARIHTGHAPAAADIRVWAGRTGTPLLDLPALVTDHLDSGQGNRDGLHWGWAAHRAVGSALAEAVIAAGEPVHPANRPTHSGDEPMARRLDSRRSG